jgi:hypothetical protein
MWFTEDGPAQIGRITAAGVVTQYFMPVPGFSFPSPALPGGPNGITVGPDGELWFPLRVTFASGFPAGYSIGEAFFVTADLTVSPDAGFYRKELTFTGSGFAPNESVQIYVSGVGSAVLATATTDSSGSFTVLAREPQAPFGPRVYVGVGRSSRKLGAASLTVTPNVILDPDSGPVGSTVTAAGYGFPPFYPVKIYWGEPSTLVGTATADVNGTFGGSAALTFTVPTGASPGVNRVQGAWDCGGSPPSCPNSGYGSFTVE